MKLIQIQVKITLSPATIWTHDSPVAGYEAYKSQYKSVNLSFFKSKMDPEFDKKMVYYLNIIYPIDHLFCIVLDLHRGKPPLLTEWYDKFIGFLLISYRFPFGSNLQEFGLLYLGAAEKRSSFVWISKPFIKCDAVFINWLL